MKVEGNKIYAEDGKLLRRINDRVVVGSYYSMGRLYYLRGVKLDSPILEKPQDFEELTQEEIDADTQRVYAHLVESYIKEIYSIDQELAIQRQRDSKPEQFKKYFDFCEDCKIRAKEELGL